MRSGKQTLATRPEATQALPQPPLSQNPPRALCVASDCASWRLEFEKNVRARSRVRMKRRLYLLTLMVIAAAWALAENAFADEHAASSAASIARVSKMPNLPQPLAIRDWSQVTRDYLDIAFDFDRQGPHLPLIRWTDDRAHDGFAPGVHRRRTRNRGR